MGFWAGALLEAQHLVKGPQGLGCCLVVLLGGEGRGSNGFWVPGREGEVKVEGKHQDPQLGPGCLSVVPWVETPDEAVFPEAGSFLRDTV